MEDIALIISGLLMVFVGPFLFGASFMKKKMWTTKLAAAIFTLSWMFVFFSYTLTNHPSDGMVLHILGYIMLIVSVLVLVILPIILKKKHEKKEAEEKEAKNSVLIYKKCIEKGIHSINNQSDLDGLRIIAGNYGVTDIEYAKIMFCIGEESVKETEREKEQEKIQKKRQDFIELRSREMKDVIKNKEEAELEGREKYIYKVREVQNIFQERLESHTSGANTYFRLQSYSATKHDSAIWGGIANGIAGPAAELSTAYKTEIENAKAEERAATIRASAKSEYSLHLDGKYNAQRQIKTCQSRIDQVENIMCDTQNIEEKFKLLSFSDLRYVLRKSRNVDAS